jgi:oleandomycin transport system permease protein
VGGPVAHGTLLTLAWSVGLTAVMAPISIYKFRTKT